MLLFSTLHFIIYLIEGGFLKNDGSLPVLRFCAGE